jgi:hypothetical protein
MLGLNMHMGEAISSKPAARIRNILQFNGTSQYGVLNTPVLFAGNFNAQFVVACTKQNLGGKQTIASQYIAVPLNTLAILDSSLGFGDYNGKFNGTSFSGSFVGGVTPCDGGLHIWEMLRIGSQIDLKIDGVLQTSFAGTTNSVTVNMIAADSNTGASPLKGHIESVKFTDNSGATPIVTKYTLKSGSLTTEYADGEISPSAKYITWYNFAASVWGSYLYNSPLTRWDWRGSLVVGSAPFTFIGTALTPLSAVIAFGSSVVQKNWEGLYVDLLNTHTYAATPDGVSIVIDILTPNTLSSIAIPNTELIFELPAFNLYPAATSLQVYGNQITGYTSPAIGLVWPIALSTVNISNAGMTTEMLDRILQDARASHIANPRFITLTLDGARNGSPTGGITNADYTWLTSTASPACNVTINP